MVLCDMPIVDPNNLVCPLCQQELHFDGFYYCPQDAFYSCIMTNKHINLEWFVFKNSIPLYEMYINYNRSYVGYIIHYDMFSLKNHYGYRCHENIEYRL